jgi:hypothetical protein
VKAYGPAWKIVAYCDANMIVTVRELPSLVSAAKDVLGAGNAGPSNEGTALGLRYRRERYSNL